MNSVKMEAPKKYYEATTVQGQNNFLEMRTKQQLFLPILNTRAASLDITIPDRKGSIKRGSRCGDAITAAEFKQLL